MSLRLLKKELGADDQRAAGGNRRSRNAWGRAPTSPKAAPSAWSRGPGQTRSAWDSEHNARGAQGDADLWNAPVAVVDPAAWQSAPVAQGDMSAAAWGEPIPAWDNGVRSGKSRIAELQDQLDLELAACAVTAQQVRNKIAKAETILQQLRECGKEDQEGKLQELQSRLVQLVAEATANAQEAMTTGDFSRVQVDDLEEDFRNTIMSAYEKWRKEAQEREEALQALKEATELRTLEEAIEWCEELGLDINAAAKLEAFHRRDAAQKRLQELSSSKATQEGVAALESALKEAACCEINATDAQYLLENLKVELQQKAQLLEKLSSSPHRIKEVLHACKLQGMGAEPAVVLAEEQLREAEALAKKQEMATLELHLSSEGVDVERLQQAIALAKGLHLDVQYAVECLHDVKAGAIKKEKAQALVDEAKKSKDETRLQEALAIYATKEHEQLLAQWTKERKQKERAAADEQSRTSLQEAIRDKLVSEKLIDAVRGIPDTAALIKEAEGMIAECAARVELFECGEIVKKVETEIEALKGVEATLVGAIHKEERRTVNKKIFALKNDENYLSAARYLKNPEKEGDLRRKIAEAQRIADIAAVDAFRQAKIENDASKIETLLSKLPIKERGDAESFLAELLQKAKDAAQDANIVELVFQCDTRTFCQLLIEINTGMAAINCTEGHEFKLRPAASQKTLVIVFQTVEILRKVDPTQRFAGLSNTPVMNFAPHFTESTDLQLAQLRRDGQSLLEKQVRVITIPSVTQAKNQAEIAAKAPVKEFLSKGRGKGDMKGKDGKHNDKGGKHGAVGNSEQVVVAVPFEEYEIQDLAGFNNDLQHFQQVHGVKCSWRGKDRLIEVMGLRWSLQSAKEELLQLIGFYRDTLKRKSRTCYMWLDQNGGAGIDLTAYVGRGMYVDVVDEKPGQEFVAGEIIRQVGEVDLSLLTSIEELDAEFGSGFKEHVEMIVESC